MFLIFRGFRNLTSVSRIGRNSENTKKHEETSEIIENAASKENQETDTSIKLVVVGGKGDICDVVADPEGL